MRISNAAAGALALMAAGTALAADPTGIWLTENKDAVLTISDCGGQLCGRIVWMRKAVDKDGAPLLDRRNPDPAKQDRALCGLTILNDLKPAAPDKWEGHIYNPNDGGTYNGNLTVLSDKEIRLRGYLGLPIFGRSQVWTRVNGPPAGRGDDNCRGPGVPG